MKVGDTVWFKPKKCYVVIDFIEDDYVEVRYGTTGSTVETTLASLAEHSPEDLKTDEADAYDALGEIAAQNAFEYYVRKSPEVVKLIENTFEVARAQLVVLGAGSTPFSELSFMQKLNVMGVYLKLDARTLIAGALFGELSL